jgi:hypothetical protein
MVVYIAPATRVKKSTSRQTRKIMRVCKLVGVQGYFRTLFGFGTGDLLTLFFSGRA